MFICSYGRARLIAWVQGLFNMKLTITIYPRKDIRPSNHHANPLSALMMLGKPQNKTSQQVNAFASSYAPAPLILGGVFFFF